MPLVGDMRSYEEVKSRENFMGDFSLDQIQENIIRLLPVPTDDTPL